MTAAETRLPGEPPLRADVADHAREQLAAPPSSRALEQDVLTAADRFCDRWIRGGQPPAHPGLRALVDAVQAWRGAR